ncbi:hypothetical protein ACFSLT_05315 [Novosphingobium resinovorum]
MWKDKPNAYEKGIAEERKTLDLTYSLGVTLNKDGDVTATLWDGPAYNAGIVNSTKIVAVGGRAYSSDVMKDAITAAKTAKAPISLLIKRGERYQTVAIDYHGGLRHPWLESTTPGKVNGFDKLLTARAK